MNRLFMGAVALLVFGCGQSERVAGNGSETTTGLSARILDDQGKPVAGARVEARPTGWTLDTADGFDPVRVAMTGEDGMASFSSLPSGDWSLVSFGRSGAGLVQVRRAVSALAETVDLRLGPVASVHGVIDPSGGSPAWITTEGFPKTVRPDASGAFRIDSLPAATVVLRYASQGGNRGSVSVRARSGEEKDVGVLVARSRESDVVRTDSVNLEVDLGGLRTDTLLGYPLLVRINDSSLDFSRTRGADLRFLRGGRVLSHEVEDWNSSARTGTVWVRVDTVLPTDRHLDLTLRYGGVDVADWSQSREVFSSADGWRAVWHLGQADPGKDATGAHRAVDWRTSAAPGAVGAGRFCDTGWLHVPDAPDLRPQSLTLSAWARPQGSQIPTGKILSKGNLDDWQNTWSLQYFDGSARPGFLSVRTDSVPDTLRSASALPDRSWSLVTATWDRSTGKQILYVDAQAVDSSTQPLLLDYQARPVINMEVFLGANFIGVLDEVRIAGLVRSRSWIALDHLTQRPDSRAVRFFRQP